MISFDTACHYEIVEADFEKMKSLYIARDLAGLYAYSQRYSQSDDDLYNELIKKLLIDRNYTMAEKPDYFCRGMKKAGMAAIGKHFPGHGSVKEDSHHILPVDGRRFQDVARQRPTSRRIIPFVRTSTSGQLVIDFCRAIS